MNWFDDEDQNLAINTQVTPAMQRQIQTLQKIEPKEKEGGGMFGGLEKMMGGMGGMGGEGGGDMSSMFSDKRLKKDVKPTAEKDVKRAMSKADKDSMLHMVKCLLEELKEKK